MKIELPANNKLPTSADFTPNAIQKALVNYANGHWLTRYSIPLFLGSIVYGALFGFTYGKFLISLSFLGLGAGTWLSNFFLRADKFKMKYVETLNGILNKQAEAKLSGLKEDLIQQNESHAARQLEQFINKFDVLVDILKIKFDEDSLTYARYYGIAQEVYLSGLDNLRDIVTAHITINSIDLNYIQDRKNKLGAENQESNVVRKELEALERSIESLEEQKQKIKDLMAENEVALTQMDETTIAISEIKKSKDKQGQIDMENSMKALSELKERTKYYSR